ncbi:MAG TPA: FCD domain-containing protein [Stellaceae bacterium]|nr:FCD domain-containing protein [Stellaceae bacterium]
MKRAALPVAEEEGIEGARTLGEVAYRRLRTDIVMLRLEPDRPLRFDALKAQYGLGVSPLREALSRLVEERLVTTIGQRGFRVAPMSLDEMWEVTRLRQELEAEALRASIAKGDERWEAAVLAALHQLSKAPLPRTADRPAEDWERRHRVFHDALIGACGSPWLLKFVGTLHDHLERYRYLRVTRTPPKVWARDLDREHRELFEAALARDASRAVELLNAHISRTADFIAVLAEAAE